MFYAAIVPGLGLALVPRFVGHGMQSTEHIHRWRFPASLEIMSHYYRAAYPQHLKR